MFRAGGNLYPEFNMCLIFFHNALLPVTWGTEFRGRAIEMFT